MESCRHGGEERERLRRRWGRDTERSWYQIRLRSREADREREKKGRQGKDPVRTVKREKKRGWGRGGQGAVETKVQCRVTWQLCLLFDFDQAEMGNARWCGGSCRMLKSWTHPYRDAVCVYLCVRPSEREDGGTSLPTASIQWALWKPFDLSINNKRGSSMKFMAKETQVQRINTGTKATLLYVVSIAL